MFGTKFQNLTVSFKICRSLDSKVRSRSVSRRADEEAKVVPRLVYLHNPWTFVRTKWQFLKLRLMWDRDFLHDEFIRGTKQSVIVVTDKVRDQDGVEIGNLATPLGFQQITRDMMLSRHDVRMKLIHFRVEDIHRAIPMKVKLIRDRGLRSCLVDMVFVAMRNSKDFPDFNQMQQIQAIIRDMDQFRRVGQMRVDVPHRILFAEIYMRFFRDYAPDVLDNWSVEFYKILSFDVLNYNPKKIA